MVDTINKCGAIFIHDTSIIHILPAMKVGFLRLRPREGIVKYGKRNSLLVKAKGKEERMAERSLPIQESTGLQNKLGCHTIGQIEK